MLFHFQLFAKLLRKSFFNAENTPGRLTPQRWFSLLFMLPIWIVAQTLHNVCMMLDYLIFPDFRNVEIKEPTFIVGVHRSGTTFLHRLMARDSERYTSMRLWEVLYGPSIIQRKVFFAFATFDRMIGSPFTRFYSWFEGRVLTRLNPIHSVSFLKHEEDEVLYQNNLYSAYATFFFPFDDEEIDRIIRFDTDMPEKKRRKFMKHYKESIQRHMYIFGPDKQYLSKNPGNSARIRMIKETFPDAKIVCTVRSPLSVVPSTVSLVSEVGRLFFTTGGTYPLQPFIKRMVSHWYRYPVRILEKWDTSEQAVVNYDDLTANPAGTVRSLYRRFGYELDAEYERVLSATNERQVNYASEHDYSLDILDQEVWGDLREAFRDVFDEFEFKEIGESLEPFRRVSSGA